MQLNCSSHTRQDRPPPQNDQSRLVINDASMLQKPSSEPSTALLQCALAGKIFGQPFSQRRHGIRVMYRTIYNGSPHFRYASLIEGQYEPGLKFPMSWPRSVHPLRTAGSSFSSTPPGPKYDPLLAVSVSCRCLGENDLQ